MHRLALIAGAGALICLGSCSLSTYPHRVTLSLAVSPPSTNALPVDTQHDATQRSGPELSAMKCYGLIVKGAPGALTSAQLGYRSPSCLGMAGTFFGPYTYAEITKGVSINLSAATYEFSIVGFHGVTSCGASGVGSLYGGATPAENYEIGSAVTANLATETKVAINATAYTAASAVNRTPSCQSANLDCSSIVSAFCDSFTDPDGTTLATHFRDSSQYGWTVFRSINPTIESNALNATPDNAVGQHALFVATAAAVTDTINVVGTMGEMIGPHGIGAALLVGAIADSDYALGEIVKSSITGSCSLQISERIAGATILRKSLLLGNYSYCPADELIQLDFRTTGGQLSLTAKGQTIQHSPISGALNGVKAGVTMLRNGNASKYSTIDFVRAMDATRNEK